MNSAMGHTVSLRCSLWASQQALISHQIPGCCGPGLLSTQSGTWQIRIVNTLPNFSHYCYLAYIRGSLWRINKVTFKTVDNPWLVVSCHCHWLLMFIMSSASSLPFPDTSSPFPPHHSDWQGIPIVAMVCGRRDHWTLMNVKENKFLSNKFLPILTFCFHV